MDGKSMQQEDQLESVKKSNDKKSEGIRKSLKEWMYKALREIFKKTKPNSNE